MLFSTTLILTAATAPRQHTKLYQRKEIFGMRRLVAQVSLVAEKVIYFVIPSEARNLSSIETQEKRDSSLRSE